MYDFVDGIYAVGHDAQEERRYAEGIIFYRLPTLELWKHELGMIVLDFTIDPAQDLLVLLSFAPRDSMYEIVCTLCVYRCLHKSLQTIHFISHPSPNAEHQ